MPYRTHGHATDAPVSILMVTSRETKRWVIPKGNIMRSVPPHTAAAIEAEEEAGVRGTVFSAPLGSFRYIKKRRDGTSVLLDVDVFPLEVTEELDRWKEKGERERRWFSLTAAAGAVEEADLAALIRAFDPSSLGEAKPGPTPGRPARRGLFGWFRRLLP